jgi:hypothetical protein
MKEGEYGEYIIKSGKSVEIVRPLTRSEAEALFSNFEQLALWKPLISHIKTLVEGCCI